MTDYLSRLFVQTATWTEIVPADSSLSEETTEDHALAGIRISVETIGRLADGYGMGDASNATLYWLIGKSTSDGDASEPVIKMGDYITTDERKWTVVSVNHCETLRGDRKHLEVKLT